MTASWPLRPTFALVDLDVVRANVAELRRRAGAAELWCVVKANGYGHGAVAVAQACVEAGADGLCVALTQEALELRSTPSLAEVPILVLSEQPTDHAEALVAHGITPTLYRRESIAAFAEAARLSGRVDAFGVHLKVDTGMSRVGCAPGEVPALVEDIERLGSLRLDAVFTHLARADEPDEPFTTQQLERFVEVVRHLPDGVRLHAHNSAGLLAHDVTRVHAVRAGVALYGLTPGPGVAHLMTGLRPAMQVVSAVGFVKRSPAGSVFSYGSRVRLDRDATVATVPVGYADGVPRRLGLSGGEVLIGGKRRPILGVVTMDQVIVDCGDDDVAVGDEVVLIGRQGDEDISATDWAEKCGTINYEIVCGISARVPRRYRTST